MDAPAVPVISAAALRQSLVSQRPPLVIDVRKAPTFLGAPDLIRGALRPSPLGYLSATKMIWQCWRKA